MKEEMNQVAEQIRLQAIIIESVAWDSIPTDNAMVRLRDIRLGLQRQAKAIADIESLLKVNTLAAIFAEEETALDDAALSREDERRADDERDALATRGVGPNEAEETE